MAVHFRVRTTDSMPERLDVTQEVERRKREAQLRREKEKTTDRAQLQSGSVVKSSSQSSR
jgi:hypothetical protein